MVRHVAAFLLVAFSGAFLDLATKDWAFEHNPYGVDIPVIPGWFSFGKTLNPGVVFGMGPQAKTFWLVVAVLAVPLISGLFLASLRKPRWLGTLTLGMILAGTIGNMVDRIRVGAVRDFLKFFYVDAAGVPHVWPLFNLADSYICVGVFLLTLEMLVLEEKKKPSSAPKGGASEGLPPAPPSPAAEPAVPPPGP